MKWYYQLDGETAGPVSAQVVRSLLRREVLSPDTRVRSESDDAWIRLADSAFMSTAAAPAPPPNEPASASHARVSASPVASPGPSADAGVPPSPSAPAARQTAELRLARGEISEAEFTLIVSQLATAPQGGSQPGLPVSPGVLAPAYAKAAYPRSLRWPALIAKQAASTACLVYLGLLIGLWKNMNDPATLDALLSVFAAESTGPAFVLVLQVLIYVPELVLTVAALVWMYRACWNLYYRRVAGLEITPGWAVGWWFVPIAFFYMPFRAMQQIAAATQHGDGWRSTPADGKLIAWWILFWASQLLSFALPAGATTQSDVTGALAIGSLYAATTIAALTLFAEKIGEITEAQQEGAAPTPYPVA